MKLRTVIAILVASFAASGQIRATNIILVTADGLRWQELFGGIDPALMNEKAAGMDKAGLLRKKLWRDSPEERRRALMPFFWDTLAPTGLVLGNVSRGSSVRVINAYRVSYPGYAEILTGRAQDQIIRGNAEIPNPTPTVLEFLREKLRLSRNQVALFGSWSVFRHIGEHKPGSIFINAGYQEAAGSPRMLELSALQFRAMSPWDTVRHDYVTLEMALEHLRTEKPRVMYIALGETDDWAHDRRYDRTLQAAAYFDQALRQIAAFIEETPEYRGRTALVITSDHGRGSTLEDWHGHGPKVAGAEYIWLALFGPGIPPRGEVSTSAQVFQRDIAPTLLDLLGIDYREYNGVEGTPLKSAP